MGLCLSVKWVGLLLAVLPAAATKARQSEVEGEVSSGETRAAVAGQ